MGGCFRHIAALATLIGFTSLPAVAGDGQPVGQGNADLAQMQLFDASPATRQAALNDGRKASFFCANCHGADGNSNFADVPNLAGQHPDYLFTQLGKFARGERKNDFMQKLVKALSKDEQLKIVYYYSNTAAAPRKAAGNAALGRTVFVRSCSACHGMDAHGMATIPRLAGQPATYLELSLTRYRERTGERVFAPMSAVVSKLSASEMNAVIAYLTTAP